MDDDPVEANGDEEDVGRSARLLALASPASLKGVLTPQAAAEALAVGLRRITGITAVELPVADGGEGTAEVLAHVLGGDWHTQVVTGPLDRPVDARWLMLPDRTAVVESRLRWGSRWSLPPSSTRCVLRPEASASCSSRPWREQPRSVLVGVGGTATVDGGAGLREVLHSWPSAVPLRVACDVQSPLLGARGAARVFGPQKGADEAAIEQLESRLAALVDLLPFRDLPGAGAGGGLERGWRRSVGSSCPAPSWCSSAIGFDKRAKGATVVITGEGTVDATTREGKAAGAVVRRCAELGVRCELFGGVVRDGIQAHALSGDPTRAVEDLVSLGERLGGTVVAA